MTKLRWDKADRHDQDPGAVIAVPDNTRPWTYVSTEEKARRARDRRKEARERGKAIRKAELAAILAEHRKPK